MLEEVEVLTQLEARVTGGEGSNEEVDTTVVRRVVSSIRVTHFQSVRVADPHRVNVVGGIGHEDEEVCGDGDSLGGGLTQIFPQTCPKKSSARVLLWTFSQHFLRCAVDRGGCPHIGGSRICIDVVVQVVNHVLTYSAKRPVRRCASGKCHTLWMTKIV